MRYYLDTKFIERDGFIDLISIGIVCEDGREYYAVNRECNFCRADMWVWENVLAPMGITGASASGAGDFSTSEETMKCARTRAEIAQEIKIFTDRVNVFPEFWGNYSAYDWVALCQLYGRMVDLPKGQFPWFCFDIAQLRAYLGYEGVNQPEQEGAEHNALEDARYVKKLWEYYTGNDEIKTAELPRWKPRITIDLSRLEDEDE